MDDSRNQFPKFGSKKEGANVGWPSTSKGKKRSTTGSKSYNSYVEGERWEFILTFLGNIREGVAIAPHVLEGGVTDCELGSIPTRVKEKVTGGSNCGDFGT